MLYTKVFYDYFEHYARDVLKNLLLCCALHGAGGLLAAFISSFITLNQRFHLFNSFIITI